MILASCDFPYFRFVFSILRRRPNSIFLSILFVLCWNWVCALPKASFLHQFDDDDEKEQKWKKNRRCNSRVLQHFVCMFSCGFIGIFQLIFGIVDNLYNTNNYETLTWVTHDNIKLCRCHSFSSAAVFAPLQAHCLFTETLEAIVDDSKWLQSTETI